MVKLDVVFLICVEVESGRQRGRERERGKEGERKLALMLVTQRIGVPMFPVIYVWASGWLNKITIVITKPTLFNCQSGCGIFTFCAPIGGEFNGSSR